MKRYILIISLFIIAIVLVILFGNNHDYIKTGKLYISEIVPSNSYTIKDNNGEYSDYIEIYNGYNDMSLEGFKLSDSEYDTKKWVFPDITIKKGEYLIIYASGKNDCDLENRVCHLNFKLNSEGEVITLTDSSNNIISKVTYPKLENDTSYSYYNGKYLVTIPTPSKENSNEEITKSSVKKGNIIITEYMSHNKGSFNISNGGYYDFVEIYNTTDENINLKGLYLSDKEKELSKFKLPDYELKGKSYVAIYLTGGELVDDYICANFKLSDNDKKIILSSNGKIIDEVEVISLPDQISYGLYEDEWYYFMTPTPGRSNTTGKVKSLGGNNGSS